MNTAAKGRRQEHRSIRLFEDLGYRCTRAAGSMGVWDFIGVSREGIVLVQVAQSSPPSRLRTTR
jgi:Holliday junction resolvase